MNRNPKHLIAFVGRDIKQAQPILEIRDGYERWDLKRFTFDDFITALKDRIPPVNANVLGNYSAAEDKSQFGITERRFEECSWALLIRDCREDAVASSFAETMFLLNLYSPSFLHPVFYASDFGIMKVPMRPAVMAHHEDHSGPFARSEFVSFFKMLLPQSQYGAWQLDRAQKWNREDWRLFVAAKFYSGLVEYDNGKDAFGWQREAADMAATLEALFTAGDSQNEEVGYRLRKRLAAFLSHRFPDIEADTKALYKQRSAFVHGSFFADIAKQTKLTDGGPPLPDFALLNKQKEYVRCALVGYLVLAKVLSRLKGMFGDIKSVMQALEGAVIDGELRRRLMAVADQALSLLPGTGQDTPAETPMALVFQYGSNMSRSRFNSEDRLRGDARGLGLVRTVQSFELEFDVQGKNGHAVADIREGAGRPIWGVLYEIPDFLIRRETAAAHDRKSLDAIEALYGRREIAVQRPDGTPVNVPVITYTVREPGETRATSLDYARHILTGLREHDAPDKYRAYVKERIRHSNPAIVADIEGL